MTGLQSPRKNNIIFDNRDGCVAEGVAHAVVEELHAGLGPEEFRGNIQRPVGEAEDASYELLQIKTIWKKVSILSGIYKNSTLSAEYKNIFPTFALSKIYPVCS